MKEGEPKAAEILFIVEGSASEGYTAVAPDHDLRVEAGSLEDLKRAIQSRLEDHFREGEAPQVVRLHHKVAKGANH